MNFVVEINKITCASLTTFYVLMKEHCECDPIWAGKPADMTIHLSEHLLQMCQAMVSRKIL